ncbi:MAG TPA: lipid II flippase MurJ [Solirubrobacteraceae bacterium]|nr:lipid II flippase MurJ [Solirubrobacteraceae bacterium]
MTAGPRGDAAGAVAGSAFITSIAVAVAMLAGGVLAVLVAIVIGNDARTDGFFAAYAVYSIALLFAQNARTTVVARLLEGDDPYANLNRYLGAALVLFAVAGVLLVGLGGVVADLLTGDLPPVAASTARTALAILWPAIAAQLFAGLGAAMLGAHGNFSVPAFAFGGGGVASIGAFLALEPALGIDAVSVAILLGSLISFALVAAALVRAGWRPSSEIVARPRHNARAAGVLVIATLASLIFQVGYVITIAIGGRLGEGVITVFSYSYAGTSLVAALLASSVSIVLAAPIAQTWDRRPRSLWPHHESVALTGLLLLAPLVAVAWLVGDDVSRAVLRGFTTGEAELAVDLFLLLTPVVVGSMLGGTIPLPALYALGRYRAVAVATIANVVVQAGLSLVAALFDDVRLLAIAVSAGSAVSVPLLIGLLSTDYLRFALPRLLLDTLRIAAVAAVAYGSLALALEALDVAGARFVAAAGGTVLFAAAVARFLPAERDLGRRLLAAAGVRSAAA